MIYLTSAELFTGELLIPGVENPNGGACQSLCETITKYEPLYLSAVLGYEFYKDMLTNLSDPENVPPQYASLIDGTEWLNGGVLQYYEGLRTHVAQHVYYWYNRTNYSHATPTGQMYPSVETATPTSPNRKMVQAWNNSVLGAYRTHQYLGGQSFPLWPSSTPGLYDWFTRNLYPPGPQTYNDFINVFNI